MEYTDKLLTLLNTAFEDEYSDTFLYLREAELFRRKIVAGERLESIFKEFSAMELRHADRVAAKIIELGGKPRWEFKPLETSTSLREILQKHLVRETNAVHGYTTLIGLARGTDFEIILKGIREDEKEHLVEVSRILKGLRK